MRLLFLVMAGGAFVFAAGILIGSSLACNPDGMPLDGLVSASPKRAVPRDKNWFAYAQQGGLV